MTATPGPGGARGPRSSRSLRPTRLAMLGVVLLLILEVLAIRFVSSLIGGLPTLLALMAVSAVGMLVITRGGGRAWRALGQALEEGRMPARELADGIIVLVGGLLLMVPGFVTGLIGLLVVAPFTRPITRTIVAAAITKRIVAQTDFVAGPTVTGGPGGPGPTGPARSHASDEVIEGEILDDDPPPASP